jgi:sterol-4alpha-carboxylate 3-dehydrogenase (decarboxylating)
VFDGSDLVGVDETAPYTARPMDYYTQTKVTGEQLVLAASSPQLAVVALRPSGIFGEGDTVMVPTFVKQAKAGKMKYIIGDGRNMWDFTYVGNVAQAHVLVRLRAAGRESARGGGAFWRDSGFMLCERR